MGTQPDDEMIPEDLWVYKRFSALGEKLTGYPAISIYHDFKYHPKEIITGTQDWLYEHLGALFWTVELWAPNREAGINELQVDRLVPRAPAGRRPEAAEVERRALRRPGARRLAPVPASAARAGRDRRLGQDELLAQPAAAPARARGGALPGLADADRAQPAAAGAAAHRSARARRRHLARALRGGQRGLAAGLREQAGAGAQDGARRGVRAPSARRASRRADRRQAAHRRPAARGPCAQELAAGLPARRARSRPIARWPNGWCGRRAARGWP